MTEAQQVIESLAAIGKTLATAESCTGGLFGFELTSVSGASRVYRGGIISYCNEIKHRLLNVNQELLDTCGAVSSSVAERMAQGARQALQADYGLSVTGIAGPNSDETGKPVGLVYLGVSSEKKTLVKEYHFDGNREQIRRQACMEAFRLLLEMIQ